MRGMCDRGIPPPSPKTSVVLSSARGDIPASDAGGAIVGRGACAPGGLGGAPAGAAACRNESLEVDGLKLGGGAALFGRDGVLLLEKMESASEAAEEAGPRAPLGELPPRLKTLSASSAALLALMASERSRRSVTHPFHRVRKYVTSIRG